MDIFPGAYGRHTAAMAAAGNIMLLHVFIWFYELGPAVVLALATWHQPVNIG